MPRLKCTRVWLFAERENFPNSYAIRPDIRFRGKHAIDQRFNGHPLDWKSLLSLFLVIPVLVSLTRQSKISDFDDIAIGEKDIARSQITVQNLNFVRQ